MSISVTTWILEQQDLSKHIFRWGSLVPELQWSFMGLGPMLWGVTWMIAGITGFVFLHSLGPRNNWSDNNVVQEAGGSTYSATSACGQLHQSYQVWLYHGRVESATLEYIWWKWSLLKWWMLIFCRNKLMAVVQIFHSLKKIVQLQMLKR